jgi:hypothetical protein
MQGVITQRLAGLGLAAIMTLTAGGAVAVFAAGGPGENLSPMGDADLLIDLTQVGNSVLWTSVAGNVATVKAVGWPSSDGDDYLGGALTIQIPANPEAGTVNLGEKPRTIEFDLD